MVKKHIAIQVILNTLFGKSSNLYKDLTDENLILGNLGLDYEFSNEYAFMMIAGTSRKPKEVIKRIDQEIENAKKNGLNEADFSRNKKMIYGDYITEYNSVEETARIFMTDYFKRINSFEYLEKYNEVTKEYAEEILKKVFNNDKEVYSIIEGM